MRRRKGVIAVSILAVGLLCGLAGCGSAQTSDYDAQEEYEENAAYSYGMTGKASYDESEVASYDDYDVEDSVGAEENVASTSDTSSASNVVVNSNQKIIKTYNYNYETEDFDGAYEYLKQAVSQYNGYISSSSITGTNQRSLRLTARIPAQDSDSFVGQLGSLGVMVSQNESAEDITLQYTDTESRITSLKTEQERLNELLKEADTLDNIIALEDRLTEVRYELESYQSQKNRYDDLVSYSTVSIVLTEVKYTVEQDNSSFVGRIVTGLQATLRDIGNDATDFLVWLIVILPYLLVWAVIIVIIVWCIRHWIRRRKKKKQQKAEKMLNTAPETPKETIPLEMKQTSEGMTLSEEITSTEDVTPATEKNTQSEEKGNEKK